jgi:diguanylate cyclase (GGDEF)-like protein/PAS domain S-box-containing protein
MESVTTIEQRLAIEHGATQALAESHSIAEAAPRIIRTVCEVLHWECGSRWTFDPEQQTLLCAEAWGAPSAKVDSFLDATRQIQQSRRPGGFVGRVWLQGESVWMPDVALEPSFRRAAAARDAGLHGAFAFPLKADGKVVGVMEFFSSKIHQPDSELLDCMRYVGSQIGQFLKRTGAESARLAAEEALRVSEARFRSLIALSSDWYWEQDGQFRLTFMSSLMGEKTGLDPAAYLGHTRWDQPALNLTEADWARHRAQLERHEPFRDFEIKRSGADGRVVWVSISGEPVFDAGGGFVGYRGIGRDITARRREEEQLTQFRAAMDASPDMIYVTERETMRFLYANETACRLTGFSREEFLELGPTDILRVGREELGRAYDEVIAAGEAGTVEELKGSIRDGLPMTLEVRRRAMRLDGRWIIFTIAHDISLRKRTEQAMLRSSRMFAALSATNEAIMRSRSPEELYQRVCEAAVHGGKFISTSMLLPEEDGTAKLVAVAGAAEKELRGARISVAEATPEGRGLVGTAFRSQHPCVSNDFLVDERTRPWHAAAKAVGIGAGAAVPLIRAGRTMGVLLFYSGERRAFDEEIVKLLERMADNIIFALDNFDRDLERKGAEERIQYLATHDGLTGLPNRVMFGQLLGLELESARRYERKLAVLFIDLDGFKEVNDSLGHAAGDSLLKEMGARLRRALRASDVVARLGGDEFVVLIQEANDPSQVAAVARKLLAAAVRPMDIAGQECRVSASIGICMYPGDARDEEALMKNADAAMYLAKQAGKNNFQFYK